MANFEKRVWKEGDLDFGAKELNRMEDGIAEAIELASEVPEEKVKELDIELCEATTIKEVVAYINELVGKLKA